MARMMMMMASANSIRRTRIGLFRKLLLVLSLLLIMGQTACGGNDDDPPGSPAATVLNASPELTATAAVISTATWESKLPPAMGEIVWASTIDPLTAAPLDGSKTFPVAIETLYATLPVMRLKQGSELRVAWWYNGTTLDAFGQTADLSDDYPEGWLEFHLSRTAGTDWPDGEYEVAVWLDGVEVQRSTVILEETVENQP